MLRKKNHVVRKKNHVVRKLFYVASPFTYRQPRRAGRRGKKRPRRGRKFPRRGRFLPRHLFFGARRLRDNTGWLRKKGCLAIVGSIRPFLAMASLKSYRFWRCSFGLTKRFLFTLHVLHATQPPALACHPVRHRCRLKRIGTFCKSFPCLENNGSQLPGLRLMPAAAVCRHARTAGTFIARPLQRRSLFYLPLQHLFHPSLSFSKPHAPRLRCPALVRPAHSHSLPAP